MVKAPSSGCQKRLTMVLMTGARAKITGATNIGGPGKTTVAKMTHRAPAAPATPARVDR